MARMYPERLDNFRGDTTEEKLYMAFREQLDDSFSVFYNAFWASFDGQEHRSSQETDFVLVHRTKGVLVLETKSWSGRHTSQIPQRISKIQAEARDRITDSVKQVRWITLTLIDSLKQFLQQTEGYAPIFPDSVGYAVAFPNITVDKSALEPDIAREVVLDQTDFSHVHQWVEQAMGYWHRPRPVFSIRIVEEPLTAQNLSTIISALTDLSTKYWLIAKGRFADLIEYTQTRDGRFVEEAQVIVTKITHNSPFNMDWKVDISAPSVAEGITKTLDGVVQVRKRLEQSELANRAKAQEISLAEQRAAHEEKMSMLEQEKQKLEVEAKRLEVIEKGLAVQKKMIDFAREIASIGVDVQNLNADPAARTMAIQTTLPSVIQLINAKGELEHALPLPQKDEEKRS